MSKLEHLKEKKIIIEKDGLLFNNSGYYYKNAFYDLPELEKNYWIHCTHENDIKKNSYQCDLVSIIKNGMDKMIGVVYDFAFYDKDVDKIYVVCKVSNKIIKKLVSENAFYFENIHVTIKLNISNCVVQNPRRPDYCWVIFEEDVHFPTVTPNNLRRK